MQEERARLAPEELPEKNQDQQQAGKGKGDKGKNESKK